jgi:hypothetical protein
MYEVGVQDQDNDMLHDTMFHHPVYSMFARNLD